MNGTLVSQVSETQEAELLNELLTRANSGLETQEMISLAIAAVHHDLDYRTTTGDDMENIEAALATIDERLLRPFSADPVLVKKLVKSTYLGADLSPLDPAYELMTVMRDADLLGWIYGDYAAILADGLRLEKNVEPLRENFLKVFTFYHDGSKILLDEAGIA